MHQIYSPLQPFCPSSVTSSFKSILQVSNSCVVYSSEFRVSLGDFILIILAVNESILFILTFYSDVLKSMSTRKRHQFQLDCEGSLSVWRWSGRIGDDDAEVNYKIPISDQLTIFFSLLCFRCLAVCVD